MLYLNSTYGPTAALLIANQYPVSAFSSTPFPAFYTLVQVYTEANFWCSAYAGLNKAAQNGVPVWTYRFGQSPTCPWYNNFGAEVLPIFGAAHTAEIPFVFANVDNNPPANPACQFTDAEKSLSRELVGFWTSMAAVGNPGDGWPGYTTDGTTGINVINGSSSVTPGMVDYSVCDFWTQVSDAVSADSSASATSSGTSSTAVATYTGGAKSMVAQISYVVTIAAMLGVLMFAM